MADAIRLGINPHPRIHAELVTHLREAHLLGNCSFVSTNYDTLIDVALEQNGIASDERSIGSVVDYGFGSLRGRADIPHREQRSFELFKIHGSLNWLFCPVCSDLTISNGADIVDRLLEDMEFARCPRCRAIREPMIVPPTYYKDLSNVFLASAWNRSQRMLRDCTQLVFCGYSLPDSDIHIKYLVKTAQLNRSAIQPPLEIVLVNNHAAKSVADRESELNRYSRFFGNEDVRDLLLSFQEFAADPVRVDQRS